jgi:hypothetical protein
VPSPEDLYGGRRVKPSPSYDTVDGFSLSGFHSRTRIQNGMRSIIRIRICNRTLSLCT